MRWTTMAVVLVVGLSVAFVPQIAAEVKGIELRVDGLSCPFCSLGLEKKLKQVEGVEVVTIHMKQGLTEVQFKPDVLLNLVEIRRAVKEAGFTLSDIRLTLKGVVTYQDDSWVLESSGDGTRFLLFDAEHAEEESSQSTVPAVLGNEYVQKLDEAAQSGSHVIVEGRVHGHAGMPFGLLVERLELQGS